MPLDHTLFREHMSDPNLLAMLLKGHLWIESCLNTALEVAFENPDRAEIARLPFAAKLNLGLASGALTAEEAAPLKLLNRIRNRIAHDLHSSASEDDVAALEESLTGYVASVYATVRREGEAAVRLYLWLYAVLMILEYKNMVREYQRTYRRELEIYHLVGALEQRLSERGGSTPRPVEKLKREYGVPPEPNPRDAWNNYVSSAEFPEWVTAEPPGPECPPPIEQASDTGRNAITDR